MPAAGAAATALAAWVSSGTIGFDAPFGSRFGLLSLDARRLIPMLAAGAIVYRVTSRPPVRDTGVRALLPLSPLLLFFLPWLPFRVPAIFLIWTGTVTTLVWLGVTVGLVATLDRSRLRSFAFPSSSCIAVGAISFVVFASAAFFVSGEVPAGDEPHYLVITQSLLYDGDLRIENNIRRGDYHAYVTGEMSPDFLRRGRNGEIYSIHAPGLPAIVLPAFAIGGYRGVVIFLIAVASFGAALAWWLAWRVTGSPGAAWFGWAAVALSAPFVLQSFTVYPDGLAATIVLTGFWALLRAEWETEGRVTSWRPWLAHGAAVAALPWIHTRFAMIAATLGGLVLIRIARGPNPFAKATAFLIVPAVSALGWLTFFAVVYGTFDPSAPYAGSIQNSFAFLPDGLGGLLFDQGFGLVTTSPVLVVAFAGFLRARRLALDWLIVAIPYLLAVTTFAMWWAGWSSPARFFVPLLLPLAVFAAQAWCAMRERGTRATAAAALLVTCWLAAILAAGDGGRLGFHNRSEGGLTAAPWIDWAIHGVNAAPALPAFVPLPIGTAIEARHAAARAGFLIVLPWLICLGAAAQIVRLAGRRLTDTAALAGTTTLTFAAAGSCALAINWTLANVPAITVSSAQVQMLRGLTSDHVLAIDLLHGERISRNDLIARTRIAIPLRRARPERAMFNQPILTIPALPAGDFLVTTNRRGGDGWIMLGIARDQFSLVTQPAHRFDAGVTLHLPIDARALVVRADEEARRQLNAIEIRPVRLVGASAQVTNRTAFRAVRYGETTVFFLDDRVFPEPAAFWVRGAGEAAVVIEAARGSASQPLLLRNVPVENTVTLSSGSWRIRYRMNPGEQRLVDVPIEPARGSALVKISSAAGFSPAASDASSRDGRYLGVYVQP
ncbi:MAG TPA: hypothetical protein VH458_24675 [Vicinamibacterales bacterium]